MKLHERIKRNEDRNNRIAIVESMFMEEDETTMMNNHLEVGEYIVSIQCSAAHYSEPRKSYKDLSKYSSMEMAFWLKGSNVFLAPYNFKDFELIEELKEAFEGSVYGCVDVETLEKFIEYLETKED